MKRIMKMKTTKNTEPKEIKQHKQGSKKVIAEYEKQVEKTRVEFQKMHDMGKLPEIVEYNKKFQKSEPEPDPERSKIKEGYETMTTILSYLKEQVVLMLVAQHSDFEVNLEWTLSHLEDKITEVEALKETWFDFTFPQKKEAEKEALAEEKKAA
jgi:hypothetical protein